MRAKKDLLIYASIIDIPTRRFHKSIPPITEEEKDQFQIIPRAFAKHHRLWLSKLQDVADGRIQRLMGLMPPGSAKPLSLDTPIPTPEGWKLMGELRPGDKVFGDDGNPCNVTGISPIWKDRPVYKVITDSGDEIIADAEHEWKVLLSNKPGRKFSIKTTEFLAHKGLKGRKREVGKRSKRPMIKIAAPLDLPEKEFKLDPYVLGVWLGNGTTLSTDITCHSQDVEWYSSEFKKVGFELSVKTEGNRSSIRLLKSKKLFSELGLLSSKKFIPKEYLRGSIEQRRALLQGLIDTDAWVSIEGHIVFTNTNYDLILGVAELVRSLGAKATISDPWIPILNGKECSQAWHVSFFMSSAARLPRKAERCKDGTRTPNTYIDIEPYGIADTVCIEVDSPTHMFLCGRSMTPTHNSLLTSVCFPTYYLGRFPGSKVIVTGYGSDLPKNHGKYARAIVSSERYRRIFATTLADDSTAVDEWALTNGSQWYARGILAGLTGHRADGIIWDDLIKGREEADSPTIRNKTYDAYLNDLLSRRRDDDTWEIGVNTRWNEDDPAGRILPVDYNGESGWIKGQDGNDWYVVCLPAICERDDDPLGRQPGDLLWPEQFSMKSYATFMQDARTWTSLFQQRPAPETGAFFEDAWFRFYSPETLPARDSMHIYGASDYAVAGSGGDYTVHIVVGVDKYHDIYVLDLWRQRVASDRWVEAFCDLVSEWHPMGWAEESGQIKAAMEPLIKRRLSERQLYVARKQFPTKADKQVRAQSFRGRMGSGKVYFPKFLPWFPELRREMLVFPSGKNDDQVDALGLIGQVLDIMVRGDPPEKPKDIRKVLSMNQSECTLTLEDLFDENEKWDKESKNLRIW